MLRNYFTLYHAAMELHERLAGGKLSGIYSQQKNELTLSFTDRDGRHMQLFLVTHTPRLSIYTREGASGKARNSATLMSELNGQEVLGFAISPTDREITIHLASGAMLVMQLFTANTNLFLVRENRITDAFKQKSALVGKPFQPDHDSQSMLRALETVALDKTLFLKQLQSESVGNIAERISAALPGFDRTLVREMLNRADGDESPETLFTTFQSIFYELLDPVAEVRKTESGEPELTLLHNPKPPGHTFDSVLEGLASYSSAMLRFLDTREELKSLRAKLQQQLKKNQKKLDEYNPEFLAELARNYETSGHLLMASLYQPRVERASITVKNIFDPDGDNRDITIPLKEALTLQENAEHYFSKASKTRGKLKAMQERHQKDKEEKAALETMLEATATLTTPKEARRFLEQHGPELKHSGALPQQKKGVASPFKSVQLSASITLFIGKNATNNDLLTFTHAKPNDIWLHARGAAGSHCLLKGATLDQITEIRKAAEIAAWHSAAKHSELVPVIYTLKKYVRHGKNLPPGQVIVEREQVLLVRPAKEG